MFYLFLTIPAMMNMMPAVRLILALLESAMLFIVRQVREKTDITAPRTLSTTPTIIRARTAWKAPGEQKTQTHFILSQISLKLLISSLRLTLPKKALMSQDCIIICITSGRNQASDNKTYILPFDLILQNLNPLHPPKKMM